MLKLPQKITSSNSSLLYEITFRQLVVKKPNSHSWFIIVAELCTRYNLPTLHEIFQYQPTDAVWKDLVTNRVNSTWERSLKESATTKSSLRYFNLDQTSLSKPHIIWEAAVTNDRTLPDPTTSMVEGYNLPTPHEIFHCQPKDAE